MHKKNILRIAIITGGILLIPLLAMQFSDEVNWSLFDFLLMGTVLFSIGLAYEVIARKSKNTTYRVAFALGLLGAFLLFWVNGAVGIIGDGPVNMLYGSVFLVGLIGSLVSRFKASGMALTLFSAALVQMLIPVFALFIWPAPSISWSPGVLGVFVLNAFFATIFVASGLLFRNASH